MKEERASGVRLHEWEADPANDNRKRPKITLDGVLPEDVGKVVDSFWTTFKEARPRIGRLSSLRDFAVNMVRLYEMLTTPGFALPWRSTAAIVFGLAYFISSVDLIPDVIPVLGFLDDALVVAEVMVMVAADLARFEATRREVRSAKANHDTAVQEAA